MTSRLALYQFYFAVEIGLLSDETSHLTGWTNVPTGFASFPRELPTLDPPRSLIARNFNLVRYTKMPHGGHFACWEQPDLLVKDLREFFRKLRT